MGRNASNDQRGLFEGMRNMKYSHEDYQKAERVAQCIMSYEDYKIELIVPTKTEYVRLRGLIGRYFSQMAQQGDPEPTIHQHQIGGLVVNYTGWPYMNFYHDGTKVKFCKGCGAASKKEHSSICPQYGQWVRKDQAIHSKPSAWE